PGPSAMATHIKSRSSPAREAGRVRLYTLTQLGNDGREPASNGLGSRWLRQASTRAAGVTMRIRLLTASVACSAKPGSRYRQRPWRGRSSRFSGDTMWDPDWALERCPDRSRHRSIEALNTARQSTRKWKRLGLDRLIQCKSL